MSSPSEITSLLDDWRDGREDAFEQLFALVYDELRALAASYMRRERPDHTLQATALVNEAYLKLAGRDSSATPENRLHFFAVAAKVMRQILIDHARSRRFEKRGGGAVKVPLVLGGFLGEDVALERLSPLDRAASAHLEPLGGALLRLHLGHEGPFVPFLMP